MIAMRITRKQFRRLIRESIGHLSGADDFIKEVAWYQSEGIGRRLTSSQLADIYNSAPVEPINPVMLDGFANSYTSLINGTTINDRFKQFVDFYLAEQRSPETTRGSDDSEKINYLASLVRASQSGIIDKPINVLEVEGVGSFISGGRTRAAAAKVGGVTVNAKIINIPAITVDDIALAKQLHSSLKL